MSQQLLLHFFKKWAPAPVPFPSDNETHRASSSLVAIKLSNIKVGCEAPGMFICNLDIVCAVQLRSSVKCMSLFAQKGGKEGDKQVMKHTSNENPYLNGNPTRTVAISKATTLLDISVGIRINYDNR